MARKEGSEKAKFQERTLQILKFVRDNEPVSMGEVHDNFDLTKGAIGSQLKRLAGQGHLKRSKGAVYSYEITDNGKDKIDYIEKLHQYMDQGKSYPEAKDEAISEVY